MSFTKLDYCQYLLNSQINYTMTNMADHLQKWSHDTINRYLKGEKLSSNNSRIPLFRWFLRKSYMG